EVGPGGTTAAMNGLDAVSGGRRDDVYWVLRQTLVSHRQDLEVFDRAFAEWFFRPPKPLELPTPHGLGTSDGAASHEPTANPGEADVADEELTVGWSPDELLRDKDFSELDEAVLARAPPLRPRAPRDRLGGRGLRLRHAPDAHHRGARVQGPDARARPRRAAGRRLVGRHADRRLAQGFQRRMGQAGTLARSRR